MSGVIFFTDDSKFSGGGGSALAYIRKIWICPQCDGKYLKFRAYSKFNFKLSDPNVGTFNNVINEFPKVFVLIGMYYWNPAKAFYTSYKNHFYFIFWIVHMYVCGGANYARNTSYALLNSN